MRTRILSILLVAIFSAAFFTSCLKSVDTPTPEEMATDFESLQVPAGFTWSTLEKSAFIVQIVDAENNPTDALNGYPLDATDMKGNLLQRTSILDGKARFLLELNKSIETVRLYSPSHEISQNLNLKGESKTFKLSETLKSVKAYEDSDSDGVFDEFDDFPNDADKAYIVYYPSPYSTSDLKSGDGEQIKFYYQMFEDLWPSKGDYDLNDLVIKLRMVTIFDGASNWTSGSFDIYIWTNGAGNDLGVGIEFFDYLENQGDKTLFKYLQPGQLHLTAGSFDPVHTKVDPDVDNAIIVFSQASDVKPVNYWNTGIGLSYDPTANYLSFSYTVDEPTFWMAGFMYLFYTSDRGREVRPVGFPPTTAATFNKLGTFDDNSPNTWDWTPGTEFLYPTDPLFYATSSKHPWGIELEYDGNLKVPFERVSIIDAFPDFKDWAESGGTINTNWYENPVSDPTLVFDVETLIGQ